MLKLGPKLSLPLDFVTKTAAILAQRRKGKTYLASVIAEELVKAKQPFVALDPTGAWWGLRASADGTRAGLPVVVLGGQHGDVPLERTGGRLIADLVVEAPGYYVIDFSLFESGEAERQFAVDFGERLYRAKGQPGRDFPLHLFVDEADRFVPQQIRKGSNETSARLLGAFEAIIRRGGLRGLGTTLISQRAAVVNKNVLEMLDILFVLRTTGPNDRAAIGGYLDAHGTDVERKTMLDSLASLDIGEAWVWEPGAEPPLFQRTQIRLRTTFNSSATPKHGETRVEPQRLADVDLARLQTKMAATIEKAKADDPRELRRQIAELKKQIALNVSVPAETPRAPVREKVVERYVLKDGQLARAEKIVDRLEALRDRVGDHEEDLHTIAKEIRDAIDRTAAPQQVHPQERDGRRAVPGVTAARPASVPMPRPPPRVPAAGGNGAGDALIGKSGLRRILIALAQRPGLNRRQLGVRATLSSRSGTFDTYVSRARTNGWLTGTADRMALTPEGLAALGRYDPLPEGADLLQHWLGQLGQSGAARILRALADVYPHALTRSELGDAANLSDRSGTFDTYLSRLRTLELVEGGKSELRASAELFD